MNKKLILSVLIIFGILFLPKYFAVAQTDTQTLISQLQEQIKALQAQVEQMRAELKTTKTELEEVKAEIRFTKTLRKGMTGDEVKQLQEFLKSFSDIYPEGLVTGYFGLATERAVKRLQSQYSHEILNPFGLQEATGVVGKSTIAKLNELAQEQGATPAIPAIPAQPSPGEGIPAIPAVPAIPATPAQPATSTAPIIPEISSSWPTPVIATSAATTTTITVVQPNGGEYLQKGSTYVIVWNSLNVSNVFIRLQKRNEIYTGTGGFISGVMPNSGYYKWTVPTTLPDGEEYKIEVVGGNYEAADTSDSSFSIMEKVPVASTVPATTTAPVIPPPTIATSTAASSSITVLYPNGGEQLQRGSAQTISWNSMNISNVYIKLRKGIDIYPGAEGVIASTIPNTGSFQWFVPTTLPDGTDYSVRVVDIGGVVFDDSDNQFSVLTTPAPLIPIIPTTPITTTSTTTEATSTSSTATTTTPYPGFYMSTDKQSYTKGETIYLTIRRADGGSYSYYVDLYAIGIENSTTKILLQGNLNVSASSGITPQINTATIEPFKSGNSGFYSLLVCAAGQICDGGINTNSMIVSYSAIATSTATTTPSITLTSPNGGEQWVVGNTYPITWTASNADWVQISHWNGGSQGYVLIATTSAAAGSYNWTIPSNILTGTGYKIGMWLNTGGAGEWSDNYFTIVASTTATTTTATTTTSDTAAPVVSNISVSSVTANSAVISWTTDEPADSSINYGTTTYWWLADSCTSSWSCYVTSHSYTLTGLYSGTVYRYRIYVNDAQSNSNTNPSTGYPPEYTFTTLGSSGTSDASSSATTTASDIIPAGEVTGLTAMPESNRITLTWTNPTDSDFIGTKVLRRVDGIYPISATDPTAWISYFGTSTLLLDTSLINGTTYYYKLFTFDASSNYSSGVTVSATPIASDTTAPQISLVAASTTSDSATITWTTDESSNSFVEFGPTTSYGTQTAEDASLVTNHLVNVSGLSPATTYHYRVRSRDAGNNLGNSNDYTFTTGQAIAMIIKGRVVNGLTNEPVVNSNMFIWNWKGSTRRDFYINSDGTFSINLTADDIANASITYVSGVFVDGRACYDQSLFYIGKNTDNTINSISVNGPGSYQSIFGIVNRTVQPTGTETDIGDFIVWPVTGFNLTSDIPVKFEGYFENGGGGGGNVNYRTSHGFSTFVPIEINTKIVLTDQSGNQYTSPYVKYTTMSQHCSSVTLNFSAGQFSWNPAGIISGSAATTTSPVLTLDNIASQLASISDVISRLMQEIKNLIR